MPAQVQLDSYRPQLSPRELSPEELQQLRGEYTSLEDDVQRYVTIYLTGLAIGASWLLGPEAVSLKDLLYGSEGYNVYLLNFIVVLNTVFFCFLLYKGLQIHELMQFASRLSPPLSVASQWEQWRRSKLSVTKPVRTLRHALVSGVPVLLTVLLLSATFLVAFGSPEGMLDTSSSFGARLAWGITLVFAVGIPFQFVKHSVSDSERRWADLLNQRPNIDFELEATPLYPRRLVGEAVLSAAYAEKAAEEALEFGVQERSDTLLPDVGDETR